LAIDVASSPHPSTTRGAGQRGRIVGVDIARTLAILGMLAVHVGPTDSNGLAGRLYATPYGRASLLFVVVAGVGVTLLAGSARATSMTTRAKLVWRAALLLPAGLALQELDHGANVILQDYALFFLLAVLAIDLPRRWLLGLAATFAATGPIIYFAGRASVPGMFERAPTTWSESLFTNVHGLVLSGPYPLITWAAPFLFGMWLGRLDLRNTFVRRRLVVFGWAVGLGTFLLARLLVALFGEPTSSGDPRYLYTDAAHGQMPLWLIGGTAIAAALLGAALLIGDRTPGLTEPLVAAGQLALTIYVGHLLILAAAPELSRSESVGGALTIIAVFTVAILAVARAWRARFRRGPLEYALHPDWIGRLRPPRDLGPSGSTDDHRSPQRTSTQDASLRVDRARPPQHR
jgi:uncharacterized membrane protein YeiB